jgi:DNA polymerase-3 subunit alpha
VREKLSFEKTAIGFYLSGHLFDQDEAEVRRFCKRRVADLIDSREPQLLASIVSDLRVINGQRGRVAIFKVDDKSEPIEAVANEELLDANKELLKDDELVIVQGKVQPDRFSGGLRLNVAQVWSLAAARARFGRYLSVLLNGGMPPVAELVKTYPAHHESTEQGDLVQGLAVRLSLRRPTATAELDLGEQGRFWPCDEALARWKALAHEGAVSIVYEA